jgi:hypothetical protein
VVEAIIQMKNLKIEAGKGFRRTLFEPELVDPNVEINFVKDSEGCEGDRAASPTLSLNSQKGK